MKLKLLFAGLVLSTVIANAQVSTFNQNFNTFTEGSTTFPQNGWSAVLPPLNNPAMQPAPMMVVYAETSDATNKYISSYSGGNSNTPQYLVSPQIAAPTGNKTLSFKARKNVAGAPVSIQVGLASSPTDMTTFVAVGTPTTLSSTTYETITVAIPSSTSSYIVFRTVNAFPGSPHTSTDIDDVIYDLTSVLSTADFKTSSNQIKFAINTQNTALQFVGKVQPKTVEIYSAAGQQIASGKVNNGQFDITTLQSGVYYILIETTEGKAVKSKFIKK